MPKSDPNQRSVWGGLPEGGLDGRRNEDDEEEREKVDERRQAESVSEDGEEKGVGREKEDGK
jgi:hypothetical protein